MNAAPEIAFSSEQGKANYAAARRQYPAQAIVDLKTMRDNMAHLVSVVGGPASGTAVMGVVKADAYGHGLLPAALAALAGGATWLGTAQSHEALLLRKLGHRPRPLPYFDLGIQRHRSPVRRADRRRHRRIGRLACPASTRWPPPHASSASPPAYTSRSIPASVATVSRRPDSTPRSPNSCRSPKRACCILWVSGAISPWPIGPMCPNSCPPPTARSKHSRTSRAAWNRPAFRRRSVTWPTRRPALDRPEIHFELTRPGIGRYGDEARSRDGHPARLASDPGHAPAGAARHGQGCGGRPWHLLWPHLPDPGQHLDRYCAAGLRRWHPPLRFRFRYGRCQARGEAGRPGAHHDH